MDKFETMMQMMSRMPESERMTTIKENKALCVCPDCPTYNECSQENSELMYCALGASATCITVESGCICPACPLTEKMGLTHDYYCVRGTESQQRTPQ